jgi:large subunit ribosomal protein L23
MNSERLLKVLVLPHVSEKSTDTADLEGQFVFRVVRDAHKSEIKKAVELMFKVKVKDVRTCNVKGKVKRRGRRPSWKKAYVSLAEGFDIDFHGGIE